MKFFKNRYKTSVSTSPETIVPKIESSGFFMYPHSSVEFRICFELFYINSAEVSLKIPINQGLRPVSSGIFNHLRPSCFKQKWFIKNRLWGKIRCSAKTAIKSTVSTSHFS
jgi:hypothetical protein